MAPEVAEEKPYNEKCDIYSLGVIFYQMLFGDYPYMDDEVLNKNLFFIFMIIIIYIYYHIIFFLKLIFICQSKNHPKIIAQLAKKGNVVFEKNNISCSYEM